MLAEHKWLLRVDGSRGKGLKSHTGHEVRKILSGCGKQTRSLLGEWGGEEGWFFLSCLFFFKNNNKKGFR